MMSFESGVQVNPDISKTSFDTIIIIITNARITFMTCYDVLDIKIIILECKDLKSFKKIM